MRTEEQKLAADRATHRRIREERLAEGLCPTCGTARAAPGWKQCDDCRAANAEYQRRRRAAMKAMGKCQDCGSRKFSHHIMCASCARARRDREAKYREARKRRRSVEFYGDSRQ